MYVASFSNLGIKDIPIDAFIVSDPGVITLIKEAIPDAELHLSTQANMTNFVTAGLNDMEPEEYLESEKTLFDMKPEMDALSIAKTTIKCMEKDYDFILVNFANPDMVGHTGIMEAAVKAIESVDECVGKAYDALMQVNGQMFICADHGNAEQLMDYETGTPFTAHTTNPVPFVLVNYDKDYTLREGGCLADIVPTLIEMMGMEQPAEMTGKSLLVRK